MQDNRRWLQSVIAESHKAGCILGRLRRLPSDRTAATETLGSMQELTESSAHTAA